MSTVLLWLAVAFVVYAFLYMAATVVSRALARELVTGGRSLRYRFRAWLPRLFNRPSVALFGVQWYPGTWAGAPVVAETWRRSEQEHACGYIGYPFALAASRVRSGYRPGGMAMDARAYASAHWREFPDLRATDSSSSTSGSASGAA